MTWMLIGTVALIFAVAYWFYFVRPRRAPTVVDTDNKAQPKSSIQDQLLAINLEVRRASLPLEITEKSESVIDQLLDLIPKVEIKASPSGELSWLVKRIATEYLPNKCLMPFIRLDDSSRLSPDTLATVKNNLSALSSELNDVAETLKNQDEVEFNKKALFLKHKFNIDGDA